MTEIKCPVCKDDVIFDIDEKFHYMWCDCGFSFSDAFRSKKTLVDTYNSILEANKDR